MIKLHQIFFVFLKIGAITFGGGLAMIPVIKAELKKREWLEEDEFLDYVAIAQVAPGMIAINIATLVGTRLRHRKGALVAVLGVALPSLIVIMSVATILSRFSDSTVIQNALRGILIVVSILLVTAIYEIGRKSLKNIYLFGYAFLAFILVYFFNIPIFIIILFSILSGAIHTWITIDKELN